MTTLITESRTAAHLTDVEWRVSATTTVMPGSAVLSSGIRPDPRWSIPRSRGLIVASFSSQPRWLAPTVERMSQMLDLPHGWDTYGSPPIDPRYVDAALRLFIDTMQDDTPTPSIVPTSRGGIQLEWHMRGMDLEIEFITPSRLRVYIEDELTGQSSELVITRDLTPLTTAITTLSRRS